MQKVYENEDFIIVNKPINVDFHGDDGVLNNLRQTDESLYGVHRLDKATSGLIIFAKSKSVQAELSQLFASRSVTKYYLAISENKPNKKMGSVVGDLEKGRGGSYFLKKSKHNPSETSFVSGYCESLKLRTFILKPRTGKTHQLRVVMKSLGAPILGDTRYGNQQEDRMYLHAFYLTFIFKETPYQFDLYPNQGKYFVTDDIKQNFNELWNSNMTQSLLKNEDLVVNCFANKKGS